MGCSKWNCYHYRTWNWWSEFKSWMRLLVFHISLMLLCKVWIHLYALQLWVNSRANWVLVTVYGNQSRRRKILNSNKLCSAKKVLHLAHTQKELGKHTATLYASFNAFLNVWLNFFKFIYNHLFAHSCMVSSIPI